MVSGWFKGITFIVNIICIIIMSAPPQIKRHQIPEVGDPWGLPWGAAMTSHSSFWMATAGLEPATSRPPDFLIIILSLPVQRTWNVTSLWVSPCLLYMFTCSDSKLPKWWKDSLPLSLNFYSLEEYCCSVAKTCLILCDPMETTTRQASTSFTISWNFLKLMSTVSVMSSNHLTLCHPLLLLSSVFPSIRVSYCCFNLHLLNDIWC